MCHALCAVQVQVADEELLEWFRHIDHVLPHKRVALSELTCAEDGTHTAADVATAVLCRHVSICVRKQLC
jgi:hypothetical protein